MKLLKDYQVVCYWDKENIIVSKFNEVCMYNLYSEKLKHIISFETTFRTKLSKLSVKVRRLLRTDIRYGLKIGTSILLIVYNKNIFEIDVVKGEIIEKNKLKRGTRPLNITPIHNFSSFDDGFYFGEYFSNPTKEEVHIIKYNNSKQERIYTFPKGEINHIHNLIVDKYRNCVWILAGDFDSSASIYMTKDNFLTVERIVFGEQEYRSCVAFAVKEGLIYATDSQFNQNSIRLLSRENEKWSSTVLSKINGSSIYGSELKGEYIFSTAVEAINSGTIVQKYLRTTRGPGIIKNQSEIIIGNLSKGFKNIFSNKKDALPFLLFQFGNISFPNGVNTTEFLIYTNRALKNNDFSTEIKKYNEI